MDNQENSQPNTQESDNQLLIDFIKDTYTIESINKVFFLFKDNETQPFLLKDNKKKLKLPVYRKGLEGNGILLKSDSKHKDTDYIDDSSDTSIVSKYNFIEKYQPSLLVIDKSNLDKDIEEYIKNILEEYKKDFSSTVLSKKTQGTYTNVLTLFRNIFKSNDNIRQQTALLSIYYYNKSIFTSYHDARNFLNTYITDYNKLDVFKKRLFDKTYNDNHFFMWFYIRYYINRTIPDISLQDKQLKDNIFHYYPRIKEAAILGICNKSKLQENKDKAMFNACLDIFQVLNFSFSDLCVGTNLNLSKYKNEEVTCYSIMCDTYGQQVDALAKTITFSENIKSNLLTISDIGGTKQKEENDILDCNSINTILNPFKDYIVSKIKPKLDEDWQGYIGKLDITNIFATINPNFYSFKKGVNKYKAEYYEERVVLLFVKLNNIMQMRFDDILESGAKIVFVFYGYNEADDKNYISKHGKEPNFTINFAGMRNDNVRFIYYDEEDNKFTSLSGELKETGNNGDNNIYFFESSDFSAQINLVSSYLKFYMDKINFLFLSYNDVHSDNSTKGAGNITCISEECANQEVSTKQCEGEIKVSLTLTGKKETISQLKDLPVYMYIDYSKEIIDSTITLANEETAKAEFGFKTESKSNLILKFSFYRSIYNNIKTGDEKETISKELHINNGCSGSYDINKTFNEKYFPDIIEITGIKLLSYNDKSLEISVLNNVKNTDKKIEDLLKYIKWKFFVTDKLVDDKAVEKTAGLADNSITIYELDDKTYNNSVVSGNKLELEYTDKFLELYTTVMNKQNSKQSLVLYPYIAYSELNTNKQNQECFKHALVIRNSGVNKFTGVLSVTISEVKADEQGIYVELEAQHDTKLVTPQINDVKWGYLILDKAGILFEKDKIVPMKEISKKIKVYYQEAWYDKYIYFFPYYKSIDTKIYALWHIEQPISLKFNGETLEILANQVSEARFKHYIKKIQQLCISPSTKPEPEIAVKLFPEVDKIAEGTYYILLDEIENSIIPVYKPIPVCYDTHDGITFSKTENTISKYQLLDNGKSIYLFNDFHDFILKLKEIADNKYNNKLYVYQNKVPIKLEVKYSKDWCDPLDKMEICLFSQGGHYKPWNATFGARQDGHKGVDLFADIGTSVYACLNGKVYYLEGSSEGALMLEVTEPEEIAIFMNRYKEYECIYNGREEGAVKEVNKGINFSMNPTKIVFRYLHLRKRFKQGEYVKKGDIIGESGDEGKNAKNTKGPHVHFEIIDNSINYDIYSLQNLSNKFRAHISAFTKVSYPEKIFNSDLLLQCKEVIGKDTLLSNKKLLRDIASYYRKQVEYLLKKCGNNIQDYLD